MRSKRGKKSQLLPWSPHVTFKTGLPPSLPRFPLSVVRCCRNFFTASSESLFHPPLFLVFFFQSSSSPAFFTSLLTHSSHLSLGLHHLLLPSSCNSAALFGSLSSAILSTCPALCSLFLTSISVKLLCTPDHKMIVLCTESLWKMSCFYHKSTIQYLSYTGALIEST